MFIVMFICRVELFVGLSCPASDNMTPKYQHTHLVQGSGVGFRGRV